MQRTLGHKLHEGVSYLNMARGFTIIGAFSGGNDSAVACDILYRWCQSTGETSRLMSIDTGLASDSWREDVTEFALRQWGTPPEFFLGEGFERYAKNVLTHGFPYTPSNHAIIYRLLKERAINKCVRKYKRSRLDRVVFVTGVRKDESHKRRNTPYKHKSGARVTLNIICEFTGDDVGQYLTVLLPGHQRKHHSQDCHCNWHCKDTVDTLSHSPKLQAKIKQLEQQALDAGLWRYGGHPDDLSAQQSNTMPDDSWCISCTTKD